MEQPCAVSCDPAPSLLEGAPAVKEEKAAKQKSQAYTTPQARHWAAFAGAAVGAPGASWQAFQAALPAEELASLSLLEIKINYVTRRGDTDISLRLKATGRLDAAATPSPKAHWTRKLQSRCEDFRRDYHLQALLYDVCMAKTISAVAAVAAAKGLAPDEAAAGMPQFEAYWRHETQKLEDICRQMAGFPNLFTVAPTEWQFPLHWGVLGAEAEEKASLSEAQSVLTLHIHNYISAILDECFFKQGSQLAAYGMSEVLHYCYRFKAGALCTSTPWPGSASRQRRLA